MPQDVKLIPIGVKHSMVQFLRTGELDQQATDVQKPWQEMLQTLILTDPDNRQDVLSALCELHDVDPEEIDRVFAEAEKVSTNMPPIYQNDYVRDSKVWPILPEEGKYGLAWDVVQNVMPNTEADEAAILVSLLVLFGNMIGRKAFIRGGDEHYSNEFLLLVGNSAVGRKGTGYNVSSRLIAQLDQLWHETRKTTGVNSGEALIDLVRDPRVDTIIVKDPDTGGDLMDEHGKPVRTQVTKDVGVDDKRLMWWAPEFSRVLNVLLRPGNTMSDLLRESWDGGTLENNVRTNPAKAKNAHISLATAITVPELLKYITGTELTNGFANRFLWCMTRKSKDLPEGGTAYILPPHLLQKLQSPINWLHSPQIQVQELHRSPAARDLWAKIYVKANQERPGMYGQIVARAAQHMIRLQLIFALLDNSRVVEEVHVKAAHAVWRYCAASIRYVFGTTVADEIADYLYQGLLENPGGLTVKGIQETLFNGKKEALKVRSALTLLSSQGLVIMTKERREGVSTGRYVESWHAVADTARDDF